MNIAQYLSGPNEILEVLAQHGVATAIYDSDEIVICYANDAMLAFWGKDRSIIGKPLIEAVQELRDQPFKKMLQNVLRTGIVDNGNIPASTLVNGILKIA